MPLAIGQYLTLSKYRGQFHPHFMMSNFYVQRAQKRKKYSEAVSLFTLLGPACVKVARKMLVKSTPGVNFINIFTRSFYAHSSPMRKNSVKLSVFFTLLGSTGVKAVHRMLIKLSPGFPRSCTSDFKYLICR